MTTLRIFQFNIDALLDLELADGVRPGEISTHEVAVAGYSGAPRRCCPFLLKQMCDWLNAPEFMPSDRNRVLLGVVRAVLAHLYLVWIHPFGDGNGRTARLLEVQVLLAAGVPMPAAQLLSNHYNKTRSQYYRELSRSSREGPLPFLLYAARGFVDGLDEQLAMVWRWQLVRSWRDYVYSQFRNRRSAANDRRRDLLLVLARKEGPNFVALTAIQELTPRLAQLYATVGPRTLSRDVAAMCREQLLVPSATGYGANLDILRSWQARRRTQDAAETEPAAGNV
ncbi:MAG: Fic family protein [Armatimonadetes bacterium]|nr:Fic family protein [Armatimonadota bacterium]MDE2205366.1 Fic family protein [Armatimonadota bacterium]